VSENKLDGVNYTERIYDSIRSPTWSDHVPLVGSYWFGEKPITNTTVTNTSNTTEYITTTTITHVTSAFNSFYMILSCGVIPLLLNKKKGDR
jgi:hypothetical protein